jgi:hypothetical protein
MGTERNDADGQVFAAETARLTFGGGTVTMTMTTHSALRKVWGTIAAEHYRTARDSRQVQDLNREVQGRGGEVSEAHDQEVRASMVAIVSSAVAVDAWYGAVKSHIGLPEWLLAAWKAKSPRRHSRIRETLKLGFGLNKSDQTWLGEIRWLFKLRNDLVHFEDSLRSAIRHPSGTAEVAPDVARYSVENAERAIKLLVDVFENCRQKPKTKELKEFVLNNELSIDTVLAELAK